MEMDHFQERDLLGLRSVVWDPGRRRHALSHFGHGCADCWWSLEQLAATWTDDDVGLENLGLVGCAGAPVEQALDRCLAFLAPRAEHAPSGGVTLRLVHRYVLEKACRLPAGDSKGLAFRRLVLEECRHRGLAGAPHRLERMRAAIRELEDPWLEARLPEAVRGLETLGWIYLADECRITGLVIEAVEFLVKARRLLDRNPYDKEIYATYFEVKADLARARGNAAGGLDLLAGAEKLLEGCEIPGRLAETRLRLGLLRMRFGDPQRAVQAFQDALEQIPSELHPRLRLDALHHLAAAEIVRGRYDAARGVLVRSESEIHDGDLVRARRAWLWGVVYLHAKEVAAEGMLRQAVDLFRKIGLGADAARALTDLGHFYVLDQRHDEMRRVTLELVEMLENSETPALSQRWRQAIVERARAFGLESALLTGLEKPPAEELVN